MQHNEVMCDDFWFIRCVDYGQYLYLHADGCWYIDVTENNGMWAGLFPSKAAAVACFRKFYPTSSLAGEDQSEKICPPDNDTRGTVNFRDAEKSVDNSIYTLGIHCDSAWYIAKSSLGSDVTRYIHGDGHWQPGTGGNSGGGFFPSKAMVIALFRKIVGDDVELKGETTLQEKICPYKQEAYSLQSGTNFKTYHNIKKDVIKPDKYFLYRHSSDKYHIQKLNNGTHARFLYSDSHQWEDEARILTGLNTFGDMQSAVTALRTFDQTAMFENETSLNKDDLSKTTYFTGVNTMCQGVIGLFNSQSGEYHWGVGSHTEIIEKIYPGASNTLGDKLVRFEAKLTDGPGEFIIEGGIADTDQTQQIQNKILDQCGTFDLLLAYIEKHRKWDNAFYNVFLDRWPLITATDTDPEMIKIKNDRSVLETGGLSRMLDAKYTPLRQKYVAEHEGMKNVYFTALAVKLKQANFKSHAEYNEFYKNTVGRVTDDLVIISNENGLDLKAAIAAAERDGTKEYNKMIANKAGLLEDLTQKAIARRVQIMREHASVAPTQSKGLRPKWVATRAVANVEPIKDASIGRRSKKD